MRNFEPCKDKNDSDVFCPKRATQYSAGYDFFAGEDVELPSLWDYVWSFVRGKEIKPTIVHTGIKVKMPGNETLLLFNRSSNPGKGLILANGVGVVDADYYGNEANDGDIGFPFYSILPYRKTIHKGTKLGQGVFVAFRKVDGDTVKHPRNGGFGSTDEVTAG
jgi:dUTP pyrophosphatase